MSARRLLLAFLPALTWSCVSRPPAPAPSVPSATPTPGAVYNPPDAAAAVPHPEPPQPAHEILPPQQSEEEEKRMANRPGEPKLIDVMPTIRMNGKPFPEPRRYDPRLPDSQPRRIFYVSAEAESGGNGSEKHPWKDLQDALRRLEPGDRLIVIPGIYPGPFSIGTGCHDGTKEAPIQVFADDAFLKASGDLDVLMVERPFWQFWEVQIALLHSHAAGFVTRGPGAHDIIVDQSHIYEGEGPAVRLEAGSSRVILSNCHIHQSGGVQIDAGARDITIVSNHIHHNIGTSLTIGAAASASTERAEGVEVLGNRFHNDRGPAVELKDCQRVRLLGNQISNYRPEGAFAGEAIVLAAGSADVLFENNSILEASIAIRAGGGPGEGVAPEKVVLQRNYLGNRLTSESTAFWVERGRDVRIYNNIVDHYGEPVRLVPAGVERVSIANNLILAPRVAFVLPSPEAVTFFDYNVFAAGSPLPAAVGGASVDAASWIAAHMPHSRIVPGADLAGGDLARIVGFSPVDGGKALEGISYRGAAPDIGVAEQ